MNQRSQVFIAVAETLSMSKAAEQVFISHQCVSGHIKSLEKEYGVKLFNRRPSLTLTEEGRYLLEKLYEVRNLETNISNTLKGSRQELVGKVTLGIPASRYTVLVPELVRQFKKEYPKVEIQITSDFSHNMAIQVERGLLDMAVLVLQEEDKLLNFVLTSQEKFLLLASHRLLKKLYGPAALAGQLAAGQQGLEIAQLTAYPLIQPPSTSRIRRVMDLYCQQHAIQLETCFETNRFETLDQLVRFLPAACLLPQQFYYLTAQNNQKATADDFVYAFPLNLQPLHLPIQISLVHKKGAFLADYKQYMLQIISGVLTKQLGETPCINNLLQAI